MYGANRGPSPSEGSKGRTMPASHRLKVDVIAEVVEEQIATVQPPLCPFWNLVLHVLQIHFGRGDFSGAM